MTAKELADKLLQHPDAIVAIEEYMGGLSPVVELNHAIFYPKGIPFKNEGICLNDDTHSGDENKAATTDIIVLYNNYNN